MKPEDKTLTVLLADDHRLVRLGFRRLLDDEPDISVVGEAGNGIEAIDLAAALRPHEVDLAEGVRSVAAGHQYLSDSLLKAKVLDREESGNPLDRLTNRERQILQLIAQARSNKEIAQILDISVNTVNVHRTNLMKTLDLHSTAELVLFGVKHGLAPLADQ